MWRRTNSAKPLGTGYALVIWLAAGSLTLSLATRYAEAGNGPAHGIKTVQPHASLDAKRQRLAKNAASWMPPVLAFAVFEAPGLDLRTNSADPPAPNLLLQETLFSRPPPVQ